MFFILHSKLFSLFFFNCGSVIIAFCPVGLLLNWVDWTKYGKHNTVQLNGVCSIHFIRWKKKKLSEPINYEISKLWVLLGSPNICNEYHILTFHTYNWAIRNSKGFKIHAPVNYLLCMMHNLKRAFPLLKQLQNN